MELQISDHVHDSMAWKSLFKSIKIQHMQVFWWDDEPDCCYSM